MSTAQRDDHGTRTPDPWISHLSQRLGTTSAGNPEVRHIETDTPLRSGTLGDQPWTIGQVTAPPRAGDDGRAPLLRTVGHLPEPGRPDGWRDLAPEILRQRLVIEGVPALPIGAGLIRRYLSALSTEIGMVELLEPVTHRSDLYGWAGWIHWESSGAHFYAWERPRLFFSVDVYTCKAFDPDIAVAFTQDFLCARTIVARSF